MAHRSREMHSDHWNYSEGHPLGPQDWSKYYQTGQAQSPIDIMVDPCYLHGRPQTADGDLIHKQLERCKLISRDQVNGRHGRHLDSVGNDPDDEDEEDSNNEDSAHRHYDDDDDDDNNSRRPHSASSSNSATSRESNSSCDVKRSSNNNHKHNHRHKHQGAMANKQQVQHQNTRYCGTNKKLFLGYPRYLNSVKLSNTGHGWQIDMPPELSCHTLLSGPPLGDREYRLAQLHCHWGADCEHGSEHQLNGRSFSAEIHFVHWNCSQYKSAEEASRHKHGLAVLGVFVQALEGEQNRNKHLDKILAGIPKIRDKPHASIQLEDARLDLKKLFPTNRWNYASYEGSLTTPPLTECVDWLLFLQPITCSSSQIDQFRQIKCTSGSLVKNCRPVQPLNQRTVSIWSHTNAN